MGLGWGCGCVKYTFRDLLILTQNIYYSAGSKSYQIFLGQKWYLMKHFRAVITLGNLFVYPWNNVLSVKGVGAGLWACKIHILRFTYSNTKDLLQCRKQIVIKYFEAQSDTLTSNFGVRPLAICMPILKTSFWVKMELGRGRGRVKYPFSDLVNLTLPTGSLT